MATKAAELYTVVTADTAQWSAGLKKAANDAGTFNAKTNRALRGTQRSLDRTGRRFKSFARSLFSVRSLVVTLAGTGGLGLLAKNALKTADEIGKTADKVGLSVEALQELRFAADIAGVSSNTLDMAMQRFSRRVGEAAQDSGELKDTLKQYGIEVKNADGSTRDLDAVLGDLADTIANAGSEQERLRIAFKAFDSEGAALVNLMRDGKVGIDALREAARKAGIVLSDDMVRGAEAMNDELTLAQTKIAATTTKLALGFAPALVAIAGVLASTTDAINGMSESLAGLINRFRDVNSLGAGALRREIEELKEDILEVDDRVGTGILSGFQRQFNARKLLELEVRLDGAQKRLAELEELEKKPETKTTTTTTAKPTTGRFTLPSGAVIEGTTVVPRAPTLDPTFGSGIIGQPPTSPLDPDTLDRAKGSIDSGRLALNGMQADMAAAKIEADSLVETVRDLEPAFDSVGDAVGDSLGQIVTRSKSAKEALKDLFLEISRIGTQTFVSDFASSFVSQGAGGLFQGASGGGFGGLSGLFGGLFGGGGGGGGGGMSPASALAAGIIPMHTGGTAHAQRTHLVGERGPELFVPRVTGEVIPAGATASMLGGAGGGLTVVQNISAADVDSFGASSGQIAAQTARDYQREAGRLN